MLKENTMLSIVTISCWSGRKYDRKVSKDVDTMYNASNAGRYNKILIDRNAINKVSSAAGKARDLHAAMTMPWLDTGARLLPAKLYMDYVQKMRQAKDVFEKEVSDFLDNYPTLVNNAKNDLGAMFNQDDYPTPEAMAKKFDFVVTIIPVPDGSDIRLDLNEEDIERIKRDTIAANNYVIANGMRSVWTRLYETIERFYNAIANPDGRIYASTVDAVEIMCGIAEKMNFVEDQNLYNCLDEIRYSLVIQDIDDIKKDKDFRKETADIAKDILDRMSETIKVLP
jgi:hypothetical protein